MARIKATWQISTFFFFNDTATTEIYTLSLHDALPISPSRHPRRTEACPPPRARRIRCTRRATGFFLLAAEGMLRRSEEHTSELQSLAYLVCRLLLEKTKCKTTAPQQTFGPDDVDLSSR